MRKTHGILKLIFIINYHCSVSWCVHLWMIVLFVSDFFIGGLGAVPLYGGFWWKGKMEYICMLIYVNWKSCSIVDWIEKFLRSGQVEGRGVGEKRDDDRDRKENDSEKTSMVAYKEQMFIIALKASFIQKHPGAVWCRSLLLGQETW